MSEPLLAAGTSSSPSDRAGHFQVLRDGLSLPARLGIYTACAVLLVAVVALAVSTAALVARVSELENSADGSVNSSQNVPSGPVTLAAAISTERLLSHLREFEDIARAHNDSRAPLFGYNASLQYVVRTLQREAPSLRLSVEPFNIELFTEVAKPTLRQSKPVERSLVFGDEFEVIHGVNGPVDVRGLTFEVVGTGCDATSYAGFPVGRLALVRRGGCATSQKVGAATAGGASAVLIWSTGGDSNLFTPYSTTLARQQIPAFSVAYWVGMDWIREGPVNVSLTQNERAFSHTTFNLLADTAEGVPGSTVVFGSHLDSVPAGPGINDDGSGSAVNLELAIQLHHVSEFLNVKNRVRFAWWGAEELGKLGSKFYLENLNATNRPALEEMVLNWNMDMLGSPNGIRGVHTGSSAPPALQTASSRIEALATTHLAKESLPWTGSPMTGGSDYWYFLQFGIPASGVATGAGGIKTDAEREQFGGLANTPYDPCYHQACDTVFNIDSQLLTELARTSAAVLQELAEMSDLRAWLNQPASATNH